MVLNMGAFLLSLAWGLLIFTLSWLRWRSSDTATQVTALIVAACVSIVVCAPSVICSLQTTSNVCPALLCGLVNALCQRHTFVVIDWGGNKLQAEMTCHAWLVYTRQRPLSYSEERAVVEHHAEKQHQQP